MTDRDQWLEWHHKLAEIAEELVRAEDAYHKAEALKKRVHAKLYLNARDEGRSQKDAECVATASDEYAEIVELENSAHREWKNAKYHYERGRMWMEAERTLEASRRAEMSLTR